MADYGAFVEIAPGVEGLIHVSEMSWSQHFRSAQDFFKVGDEIEAVILTLDRRRTQDVTRHQAAQGRSLEGHRTEVPHRLTPPPLKVRNFTNFGVFVEFEEGVDGLIHISDLSWTKKIKHPPEFTQIGADIEVTFSKSIRTTVAFHLGHKQLEENPWDVFETIFTVGSIHEGTITELMEKGAVVLLASWRRRLRHSQAPR